jgi:hypothetical protein
MFQLRNGTLRWRVESNGLQSGPESGFHNSLQVKSEPEFVGAQESIPSLAGRYDNPL